MRGWETVGAGIGNVNACAILMLSGSEPLDIPVDPQVFGSGFLRLYPEGTDRGVGALPDE